MVSNSDIVDCHDGVISRLGEARLARNVTDLTLTEFEDILLEELGSKQVSPLWHDREYHFSDETGSRLTTIV